MNSSNWPSPMYFHSSVGKALQRQRRVHGFESRRGPDIVCLFVFVVLFCLFVRLFVFRVNLQLLKLHLPLRRSYLPLNLFSAVHMVFILDIL